MLDGRFDRLSPGIGQGDDVALAGRLADQVGEALGQQTGVTPRAGLGGEGTPRLQDFYSPAYQSRMVMSEQGGAKPAQHVQNFLFLTAFVPVVEVIPLAPAVHDV